MKKDSNNVCHFGSLHVLFVVLLLVWVVACAPDSGGHVVADGPCRPSRSNPSFTVATYNIHAGVGRDGKRDPNRIAETLKGADVVGLQEVDNGRVRSGFENQVRSLAAALGHRYWQHFPAEDYWPFGTYGTAASSSLPVVASGEFDLPMIEGKPLRRIGWIKFLVDCRPIHAFIIHATRVDDSMASVQAAQIEAAWRILSEKADATREPVILLGDLNASSNSQVIRWLRERMIDVVESQAPQLPATASVDYIFVRGDLAVLNVDVRDSGPSDHPAILATFRYGNGLSLTSAERGSGSAYPVPRNR
jgi:endonuclease/exonuclease/phosphatase family metal-dependent hydrolase